MSLPNTFLRIPIKSSVIALSLILSLGGQSFRWRKHTSESLPVTSYTFALKDRIVQVAQDENNIYYRSSLPALEDETTEWVKDYLSLSIDVESLYLDWAARDPVFAKIHEGGRFSGVRMLRQDPWECLISFICSSNNNIKRIELMINRICEHFCDSLPIPPGWPTDSACHPFPSISALAAPENISILRGLGFGYRDKFVQQTAELLLKDNENDEKIARIWLDTLRSTPYSEVIRHLTKFLGVGRKVADCVALMSLDQRGAIPVDVHVWQIAIRDYKYPARGKTMTPQLYEGVSKMFQDMWGEWAGWAHSVLFAADLRQFKEHNVHLVKTEVSSVFESNELVSATVIKQETAVVSGIHVKEELIELDSVQSEGLMSTVLTVAKGMNGKRKRETVLAEVVKVEQASMTELVELKEDWPPTSIRRSTRQQRK